HQQTTIKPFPLGGKTAGTWYKVRAGRSRANSDHTTHSHLCIHHITLLQRTRHQKHTNSNGSGAHSTASLPQYIPAKHHDIVLATPKWRDWMELNALPTSGIGLKRRGEGPGFLRIEAQKEDVIVKKSHRGL
ncbi:unnamed protein product, partial [Ectocarpus sp. 8 AP-2014]